MGFQDQALRFCRNIESLTEIHCRLLNVDEKAFLQPDDNGKQPKIKPVMADKIELTASEEALRWSGHYLYQGEEGASYLAVALREPKVMREYSYILGPFQMGSEDDATDQEDADKQIKVMTEEDVKALRETVSAISGYLSGVQIMSLVDSGIQDETLQVMSLNYPVEEKKRYPIEDERKLQNYIRTGNKEEAKKLLNILLLDLYSRSGTDLQRLKMRIRELITLMSRAATEGGADVNKVLSLCDHYVLQMDMIQDFDELDACLGLVLHKFFDMVFDMSGAKHIHMIQQIAAYVQEHLTEKLTLDQVAGAVNISKSYLCRILKEDMGCTFTEYANRVRIERSKLYLHRSNMPLSEIAVAVGFDDQSYFTKIFRREVGLPPGKYRSGNVAVK